MSEGYSPYLDYKTWYRITGNLNAGKLPLVVAHGGPGCTHDYLDSFKEIAETGRPVIHYDQIGNGNSTHLRDKSEDFWTVEFFLNELDTLLKHLEIQNNYALLGQSWGGMLAAEHAVHQPAGLKALIIANSPASIPLWLESAGELRAVLPAEVQKTLDAHEAAGSIDHPDYKAASDVFYKRHVCRIKPMPKEVKRSFDAMEEDPTVYHAMNGPNEFHVIGSMKTWSIVDRLHLINAPTLVYRGAHDEATQECVQPYLDNIPGAEGHVFPNSSHMPHVEEKEDCLRLVESFVARHE